MSETAREDSFGADVGLEVVPPYNETPLSDRVIAAMDVFSQEWEWDSLSGETQKRFITLCSLVGQLVKQSA